MQSTARTVEITVFSCEDLRIDRKPVKKNTYVIVRTDHLNARGTKIDAEGGSYPSWNQKLIIDMPLHERFITLEARCRTASGDRAIATARMPGADFMGGYLPDNYLSILSYRLRDERGERNGIINVSVRVIVPQHLCNNKKKKQLPEKACSAAFTIASGSDQKNFGVVTGIPVWGASHM